MRFATGTVRVRVPATSANLGPGFDALGLALGVYDEITARVSGDQITVDVSGAGAGELATDEDNLVARCMLAAFDVLGARPAGVALTCHNRIPQARGLGSSSAAIVAGILAARALVRDGSARLPDIEALRLASDIEGHPDNVAPCLLGGFTIAWSGTSGVDAVRLDPAAGLRPVLFIPQERGLTEAARAALPPTVPHRDAARNAGRSALLVHAFTAAPDLLLPATEDWLHQPYRAAGMPATSELVAGLRAAGIPAVVSGAGPSVLAFDQPALAIAPDPPGAPTRAADPDGADVPVGAIGADQPTWMIDAVGAEGWQIKTPGVDARGAYVEVDWRHAERGTVAAGWAR